MNYIFKIACKYLFAIRHKNIINIIALISIIGVLFGTMAMVIVLSVFNGFDDIVKTLYKSIDADFKIEPKEGQFFELDNNFFQKINNIEGIKSFSEVLEYKMLAHYADHELVVDVKGVDENYLSLNSLEDSIVVGNYFYEKNNFLIVGVPIFNQFSLKLLDFENPLKLSFFKETGGLNINNSIYTYPFYVSGAFQTHTEFDNTYILLKIDKLREILFLQNKCSSIEISVNEFADYNRIESKLKNNLGDKFIIKNQLDQRSFIYKMVKTEKLAVYIIFSFILIISMLSFIGSLVVLLMEKQKDIQTLYSLGMEKHQIQNIFLLVGMLITTLGTFLGISLGIFFSFLQENFHFIKLGESAHFINAYPIKLNFSDVIIIQLIVLFLGLISSYLVSRNTKFYSYI